eukprot:TRINITY_DN19326_c0_g1_i2.p1 TRINITY_DN19326_c0_g1~~TRINITY_DN19326_c0_g1_i2.p1  ORF type:complete len:246 (-),score=38.10 TRINITY_DN19326_c0_g1_i2:100-747(-)
MAFASGAEATASPGSDLSRSDWSRWADTDVAAEGSGEVDVAVRDAATRCVMGRLRMPNLPFAAARLLAEGTDSSGSFPALPHGTAKVETLTAVLGGPQEAVRLKLEDLERAARDFSRTEVGRRGKRAGDTDVTVCAKAPLVHTSLIDEELRLLESPRIDEGCSDARTFCSNCHNSRGDLVELDLDVVGGLSNFLARADDAVLSYIISPADRMVMI